MLICLKVLEESQLEREELRAQHAKITVSHKQEL